MVFSYFYSMQYVKISFSIADEAIRELLIAKLAEVGFEGFEETENSLLAYIAEDQYSESDVQNLSQEFELPFTRDEIAPQNWNETWEQNFQPVFVPGFCTIRASFHDIPVDTPYEIVITPKMSFGTGHHATTQLMITEMQHIHFKGKKVFDFGTGTGILAILAEMLGATEVLAIDNDEWSFENAIENVGRNHCSKINVKKGSIEEAADHGYDVILANINRHILLGYMKDMYAKLLPEGRILMSGILREDIEMVTSAAQEQGFRFVKHEELNNWELLIFNK